MPSRQRPDTRVQPPRRKSPADLIAEHVDGLGIEGWPTLSPAECATVRRALAPAEQTAAA